MHPVLYAELICSDEGCAVIFEAWGDASDFERLACDCGCTLQVLAVCEAEPAWLPVVEVRAERVGFEPTRQVSPPTRFPVAHLKPLGHLSRAA